MSFGAALPKYLASVVMSVALTTTTVNAQTLFGAYKAYEEKVGECLSLSRNKNSSIPRNEWFSTLTEQDQKEVIVYLSHQAMFECQYSAQQSFTNRLSQESQDVQSVINHTVYVAKKPVYEGDADKEKLSELMNQIKRPFDIFEAFKALDIEPKDE